MSAQPPDGFRSVSKAPAPGALARVRALVRQVGPRAGALPFDSWQSLAAIWNTGWLTVRRLRALAARPLSFEAFAARRAGEGPLHLQGTCAALPGQSAATLWRIDEREDGAEGRSLIEEGHDFLLSVGDGSVVYVLSNGGRLASATPLCAGDVVSVFGFTDEVPDRWGLAGGVHGRGSVLPAIRSGSELPLLVTHARGQSASVVR